MYVEATFVVPITILIMVAMLGIMVFMYDQFYLQYEEHQVELKESYEISEINVIRAGEKAVEVTKDNLS